MTAEPLAVLCVGQAVFDLTLTVDHHPGADEKLVASTFSGWGGGPAANAAVTAARLGLPAAFCGYLGKDHYGDIHLGEFQAEGVDTTGLVRGDAPTPLSVVLVKPGGQRTLVNYRKDTPPLADNPVDIHALAPRVILFDGWEPEISPPLAAMAQAQGVPVILDAGSVHAGTLALLDQGDYLICSEKFAFSFTGETDEARALEKLRGHAPNVIITLGARGLVWARGQSAGRAPAYQVQAIDTTCAGDIFHGAFAAGLASGMAWEENLAYASAAAALSCTRIGGRPAIPTAAELHPFIRRFAPGQPD